MTVGGAFCDQARQIHDSPRPLAIPEPTLFQPIEPGLAAIWGLVFLSHVRCLTMLSRAVRFLFMHGCTHPPPLPAPRTTVIIMTPVSSMGGFAGIGCVTHHTSGSLSGPDNAGQYQLVVDLGHFHHPNPFFVFAPTRKAPQIWEWSTRPHPQGPKVV